MLASQAAIAIENARLYAQVEDAFESFVGDVSKMMASEPNYTATDLAGIKVPVAVVLGDNDEFIKREHADYLVRSIPDAELILLPEVSHFAPLQRPEHFNREVLAFLDRL